ncbi:hypothetical protein JXM83_00375 [Candidatus Woesearchaeota archaeon]|nr:hypothetical protein [Candidatus Woesearchaeota archaeon]
MDLQEFTYVDWKDKSNWIALALAAFLFWWGIKNILSALAADLILALI